MTSPNGQLTEADLVHVSAVETLSITTARAYRHLVVAGRAVGVKVTLASPGAGYRSLFVQQDMHDHPARWDLNPASSVSLAAAGHSTHGFGTRVDLLFDGSSNPTAAHLALARKFGFTREFGADDPNHFQHDGTTATGPFTDAQLAAARLYPHEDGKPNPAPAARYTVLKGDTLIKIGAHLHVDWRKLYAANRTLIGPDPSGLRAGTKLTVPR